MCQSSMSLVDPRCVELKHSFASVQLEIVLRHELGVALALFQCT